MIEKQVVFLPRVSLELLPLYQKASNILLMPFPNTEHYAYYMSPMKMFEYMASKRPIIASDLPSIKEVLNTQNAILVRPGSTQDLVRGVERLLNDTSLGNRIAYKAFSDVVQYTWKKRAKKIISFLEDNNC